MAFGDPCDYDSPGLTGWKSRFEFIQKKEREGNPDSSHGFRLLLLFVFLLNCKQFVSRRTKRQWKTFVLICNLEFQLNCVVDCGNARSK